MGSTSFYQTYTGPLSVEYAYRELVAEARAEYGYDPYNGTISTTGGVRLVGGAPVTIEEAAALAETRIDNLHKWESCEAIPIRSYTPPEYEAWPDQEVQMTVSGAVYNDKTLLAMAARQTLRMNANLEITEVAIKVQNPGFTRLASVEKRVVAEAPKEKAETRYFITRVDPNRQHSLREALDWEKGYASQAAARAALDTVLRYDFHGIPDVEVEIIGLVRRASGAPLVKATVSAKKVTGTFVVKIRRQTKPPVHGTDRAGYYFYGWAAC